MESTSSDENEAVEGVPSSSGHVHPPGHIHTEPGDDMDNVFDDLMTNYESIFGEKCIESESCPSLTTMEPSLKRSKLYHDNIHQTALHVGFVNPLPPIFNTWSNISQHRMILPYPSGSCQSPYIPSSSQHRPNNTAPLLVTHGNYEEPTSSGGETSDSGEESDIEDNNADENTHHHQEMLLAAAENGDVQILKKLLERSPTIDINYQDRGDQGTPLLWACKSGQYDVAELLLSEGADPNLANIYGWTALIYAARYRQSRLLIRLLESDADIDAATFDGRTALIWAATNGDLEMVKSLESFGAKVDHVDNEGFTALLYAIRRGHSHVAQYLMEKGADVWITTPSLKTSLHLAAEQGNTIILFNLLNRGFDVDVEDADGWTPLLQSALLGRTNAVSFLIAHGASRQAIDNVRNARDVNISTLRMNLGYGGDDFVW